MNMTTLTEAIVDPCGDERPIKTSYSANTSATKRQSHSNETRVRHTNFLKKSKVYDPKEAIRN